MINYAKDDSPEEIHRKNGINQFLIVHRWEGTKAGKLIHVLEEFRSEHPHIHHDELVQKVRFLHPELFR